MKNGIARSFNLHADLLLPYLVLVSCLVIPSEVIITRFKVDETSVRLISGVFRTVLYGYESNILLFLIGLTLFNQLFALFKSYFTEFMLIFIMLIFLIFAGFQLFVNYGALDLGIYFSLISSGFILFFNLKQRFW